jgi:hypothetical protein
MFTGLTFVVIGTLALLQVLGVYNFGLALWPVLVLWLGLEIVAGSLWGHRHHHGGSWFGVALGLVIGAIGLVPILANAGVPVYLTTGEIIRHSWPFFVVGIGLSMLFGRRSRWECHWD